MISVFDIFKVGIGPSSSHTVGPMKACCEFVEHLESEGLFSKVDHIEVDVYGSLSLTGLGHHTDIAVIMGLAGYLPHNVDIDLIPTFMAELKATKKMPILRNAKIIDFDYDKDLRLNSEFLMRHENGLTVKAYGNGEELYRNTYYSIGGGFIVDEEHFEQTQLSEVVVPYPYKNAQDVLDHCEDTGFSLSHLILQNELALHTEEELNDYCSLLWDTMVACIERGLNTEGILPGPLRVKRRAPQLRKRLEVDKIMSNDPLSALDWINVYAFAVNEENAAGGRVVTAPTNGACGIVPAVLAYYSKFIGTLTPDLIRRYFLVCSFVGSLYKMNASISGAEVGCQGEVGVACSMAAAGMTEIMGGSPNQVFIAAEIAMEHNLGLTCDPVGGQVQVPCIERNAIASVKAINASRMALRRTNAPYVNLDDVIETMYETGKDMSTKYRETSQGGLAIKIKNLCS